MQELNFQQIGKNIRSARLRQGLTQEYLASRIGVNVSHIS
ncbi:MAG: helix-turn-helix transcriptional regulator, partial [Lachnospiraceae bacterium]|nr:helix-turn-helix transcriptional regulator [Lachnospiraceae bacterium]